MLFKFKCNFKIWLLIISVWIAIVAVVYIFGIWWNQSEEIEEIEESFEGTKRNLSTLRLLHLIFRHGDRTNIAECVYDKDPYKDETYEPVGLGQLTNKGKRRMYNVGKGLRKQYGEFLGDYRPEKLYALASELQRIQNSLQLLLAGLYPAEGDLQWLPGFKWQPIPFESMKGQDNLLGNPRFYCDRWEEYYGKSAGNYQGIVENHTEYFDYLQNLTGWPRDLLSANKFYHSIAVELGWGLQLPQQAAVIFPQPTSYLNEVFVKSWADSKDQIKAVIGMLLEKIIKDSKKKISETDNVILYLYSAHDFNLITFLRFFQYEIIENPPYGSYLAIELHEEDQQYFFKFFYKRSLDEAEKRLNSSKLCGEKCAFERFAAHSSDYFYDQSTCASNFSHR